MSKTPLDLTRKQLAAFAPDQRTLKALEELVSQVNVTIPSDLTYLAARIQEVLSDAGSAQSSANQANDSIDRMRQALEFIAYAPPQPDAQDPGVSNAPVLREDGVVSADYIEIGRQTPAWQEGRIFYDWNDHSLAYYNDASDATLNIGREQVIRVFNNTGSGLVSGQLVYINGSSGGWPTVALAQANNEASYRGTIGMVTTTIANNGYGYVTTEGIVNGVNTAAYTPGQQIYLSDTVAGGFTSTKPLEPSYVVDIGYITNVNATTGAIYVHIDREPWYGFMNISNLTASTTLPTVDTILKPPNSNGYGMSYDSSLGEITFLKNGSYNFHYQINAIPSASNKNMYFYVEENIGSGWTPIATSGRLLRLPNTVETQLTYSSCRFYSVGSKIRVHLYSDATVNINTSSLPGTTPGTVLIPAFRLLIAG